MVLVVKNPPANAGDVSLIPGSGRSPREGNGNPLQQSFLGNFMDRGAWRATVPGVVKSQMWLSTHTLYSITVLGCYAGRPWEGWGSDVIYNIFIIVSLKADIPDEVIYVKPLISCKVLYPYKKQSLECVEQNLRNHFFTIQIFDLWVLLMWVRHRWCWCK